MARELIDLLWRDHPDVSVRGSRGPRAKVTTSQVVDAAVEIADAEGLEATTVRRLSDDLGISAMSVYTHIGSRDDLLVLMADSVRSGWCAGGFVAGEWRARVRELAESELGLYTGHWWLLDVTDQRVAMGPGTIAQYDHGLHAFDDTGLGDLETDAALTFVTDFVRASAQARRPDPRAADMTLVWHSWQQRLARYLGDDFPLAQRVGAAAGAAMNGVYSAEAAWSFGLARVMDALESLIGTS